MGGGVELTLACRYRVALDDPKTRFALPEVMLGIMPAWHGVQWLPKLVGPAAAFDILLTGKTVDARCAWRGGRRPGRAAAAFPGHGGPRKGGKQKAPALRLPPQASPPPAAPAA